MEYQREERPDEVLVVILDESYGREGDYVDLEAYEDEMALVSAARGKYLEGLKKEFNVEFEEVNVGPGADLPAFATAITDNIIPLLPWLVGAFFTGKPLIDNIKAWSTIFSHIKTYCSRQVVLNRQGAAAVAINAIFDEIGHFPKLLKLLSYHAGHSFDDNEKELAGDGVVQEAPPTLNLSMVKHIFEIEADGAVFLVSVEGKKAKLTKLLKG